MTFGMWRRAAHSALAHGARGAGPAFGPAARAALGEPRVAPALILGGARAAGPNAEPAPHAPCASAECAARRHIPNGMAHAPTRDRQ